MARELYKLKARETNRRSIVVVDGVCACTSERVAISISPSVEEAQEIARTKLQTTTTTTTMKNRSHRIRIRRSINQSLDVESADRRESARE